MAGLPIRRGDRRAPPTKKGLNGGLVVSFGFIADFGGADGVATSSSIALVSMASDVSPSDSLRRFSRAKVSESLFRDLEGDSDMLN